MLLTRPDGPNSKELGKLSRRGFGAAMFTAGYAAAVRPLNAAAIITDSKGLIIEEVTYPAYGGYNLPAFIARPDDKKAHAAVIVVNEVFGIHEYIKDICRRLAKLGYAAIAPDYFDRGGDPSVLGMDKWDEIRAIVGKAKFAQVMGDTDAAFIYLKGKKWADVGRLGITGYCYGGGVTWSSCAMFPHFKAGVAWYGQLRKPGPNAPIQGEDRPYPLDSAKDLKAPVLGLYAELDKGIPLSDVEAMRAALAEGGKSNKNAAASKIIVYPGAEHGFHGDYRPSYNEAAAKDGWAQMLDWFKTYGVA
jgi:carboxymethylenebutenolidase